MTDRELLEAAAKAAGIVGKWGEVLYVGPDEVDCSDIFFTDDGAAVWDPLASDGDALRLAVALKLNIGQGDVTVRVDDEGDADVFEFRGSDPYAATRRAIVRAAASIGGKD